MLKINTDASVLLLILSLAFSFASSAFAQNVLDVEVTYVSAGYNDLAIPGNSGDDLSLTDDLDADDTGAFRIRYARTFSEKHWAGILLAPLTMKSHGNLNKNVDFNGTTFLEGSSVNATFRFNSYRLIYRYRLHQSDEFQFSIGGALKVRDAAIKLESDGLASEKKNVGIVPLMSFNLTWTPVEKLHFIVDGEAMAAPQGRAEDILFAVQYDVNESLAFKTGYRLLEGGADNDEVYTFSLFHYAVAGVTWSF